MTLWIRRRSGRGRRDCDLRGQGRCGSGRITFAIRPLVSLLCLRIQTGDRLGIFIVGDRVTESTLLDELIAGSLASIAADVSV